ncbi:hypothetical protein D9M72_619580 [compost metagenome]
MRLPGFRAAMKPSGTPTNIAIDIAAKASFRVGHMRSPISCATGCLLRNDVPRSNRARSDRYDPNRT